MPKDLTPSSTWTDKVTVPVDGDPGSALALEYAFQSLVNRVQWIKDNQLVGNVGPTGATGPQGPSPSVHTGFVVPLDSGLSNFVIAANNTAVISHFPVMVPAGKKLYVNNILLQAAQVKEDIAGDYLIFEMRHSGGGIYTNIPTQGKLLLSELNLPFYSNTTESTVAVTLTVLLRNNHTSPVTCLKGQTGGLLEVQIKS